MEATGREGEASVLSCRIPNINHENHKESSRRPSQQVLVNVHRCPTLVQSTAGRLSGQGSQTCRVRLEASTPCLDLSLPPCLYLSSPSSASISLYPPCSPVKPSQCPPGPPNWFLSCLKWSR